MSADRNAGSGSDNRLVVSRRDVLRFTGALGLSLGLPSLVGSCASPGGNKQTSGGTSAGAGTLTLAFNRALPSLDNKLNQFDAQVTVQRAVHQALTRIGQDLAVENVLAESFEQTAPTEWTVKLRQGLVYSDGTPVKIEDLAKALELYPKVNGGYVAQQFQEFPRLQKVDDRTFKLVTKAPNVTLDRLMSNILLMPAAGNQPKEIDNLPGTGPYVIKSHNKGAGTFELAPNPKYSGEKPKLSTVKVRFIEQENVRVSAIQRGEVDVIDSVGPDAVQQLQNVQGVKVIRTPGTRITQLFYNFRKPASSPLSNPKVREALSYAIDGDSIIKNILLNSVTPIQGVTPQTLVGAADVGRYTYDPEKAKSMLSSLGATNLNLLLIWESGEFFSDTQVMEAVVDMLGKVGVKASLKQFQPGGDILQWRQGRAGDWDVLGNGFGNQTGVALTTLQGMYSGTAEREKTRDTYQGYVVPKVANLLSAAAAESDEAKRNATLKQAQQAIWDTWPCMWAFVQNNNLAHRDRVQGINLLPTNFYDISTVTVNV
jgi:peptide/nickel transport system substrate-binding protein